MSNILQKQDKRDNIVLSFFGGLFKIKYIKKIVKRGPIDDKNIAIR